MSNGNNNGWNDIGKQIRDTVQGAIDSHDFKELNQTISQVVNVALKNVKDGVEATAAQSATKRKQQVVRPKKSVVAVQDVGSSVLYAKRPRGSIAGIAAAIAGFTVTGIFTPFSLSFLAGGIVANGAMRVGSLMAMGFTAAFSLAGLVVGIKGISNLQRVKRFRRYVAIIGQHEYYAIADLASATGKTSAYVAKDLREMINQGMFLNGRIDEQRTHLITSNEAYEQYLLMQKSIADKQALLRADEQAAKDNNISSECQQIISEGKAYIAHVRQCNDDIPDKDFSDKLDRLEDIMRRIFAQVEKQPQNASELHKFMNYYLPTTTKLIDAYRDIDGHPETGENIVNTKREIEDTLDTINDAFEKLLDRFFQDTAWDISSDISVMKTMLEQEGLTDSELKMTSKSQ